MKHHQQQEHEMNFIENAESFERILSFISSFLKSQAENVNGTNVIIDQQNNIQSLYTKLWAQQFFSDHSRCTEEIQKMTISMKNELFDWNSYIPQTPEAA